MTTIHPTPGTYADLNGLHMYYERSGTPRPDGVPLILLHGGFGATGMFGGGLTPALNAGREVIAVDVQGHGRTADIDRPLSYESMADDLAALIRHLGLERADVMGYSLGGGVALQTAIRHPDAVRAMVAVSTPLRREAWYISSRDSMEQMGEHTAQHMLRTPIYELYAAVAPRPDDWARLWGKMGDLMRRDYDWTPQVAALTTPTLLVAGNADSFAPAHATEFFALLGGGQRDGGWDGSGMTPHRLAILPGVTHYDIFTSPLLPAVVQPFLDAQDARS
ncbi:pimeloyl-ACP methyl ester carboxylesterase [Deinococcus metalli]|uniref:Alpha/beta hydrolase n=1 Tax=Deinococcus metalli TaxID=1141878 RepID=A0A7W8KI96_9DEIO|nr:alpha/beta hydrolase [Deinococcus metalli]MBB5376994.1 pimeloyl-ACP methyl ester carboxylesterase [Deinococcus metalli]GHF46900.1 alpha/beta hydrolase [Deinococcus metalli]